MLKRHYILVLATLCLIFPSLGQSQEVINQLLSGNDSLKSQALSGLIQQKKIKTFPLISAINDKKLFEYEGKLITTGEKIDLSEGYGYTLIQLYPEIITLVDDKGNDMVKNTSDLNEIEFSRSERLLIIPVLPYINLASLDLEKRKLAFRSIPTKRNSKRPRNINRS